MNSLGFTESNSLKPKRSVSASAVRRPSANGILAVAKDDLSTTTTSTGGTKETTGGDSRFSPAYFMSLLNEGDTIKPLGIYSDKDFQKICHQISTSLSNTDDWTVRIKGLTLLQGLAMGDGLQYEDFIPFIKSITPQLCTQILELRSSICKEACRCIAYLASKLYSSFSSLVENFLPSIMKQLSVKIAVMSSAAHRSICIILYSIKDHGSSRILPLLFDATTSKISLLRRCVLEYLCIIFSFWKQDHIDKNLVQIKQILKSTLSDADADVRRTSRYLVIVIRNHSSLKITMDRFILEFDSGIQKLLHVELNQPSSNLIDLLNHLSILSTTPIKATIEDNQNTPSILNLSSSQPDNQSHLLPSNNYMKSIVDTITPCNSTSIRIMNNPSSSSVSSSNGNVYPSSSRRLTLAAPSRISNHTLISNEIVSTTISKSCTHSTDTSLGKASRVVIRHQNNLNENIKSSSMKSIGEKPNRIIGKPLRNRANDIEVTVPPTIHDEDSIIERPLLSASRRSVVRKSDTSIDIIMKKADSTLWIDRLKAFEMISAQLENPTIPTDITILIDLCISHLIDTNIKVVLICLQILKRSSINHHAIVSTKLGGFLPTLILLLGDKRSSIPEQTNDLLSFIRTTFPPIDIVKSLCPRIHEVSDRVKTAVLQYLGVAVPHCADYFEISSNTSSFLNRLANLLGAQGSAPSVSLLAAGTMLLKLVYETNPTVISYQISLLDESQRELLVNLAPRIDNGPEQEDPIQSTPLSMLQSLSEYKANTEIALSDKLNKVINEHMSLPKSPLIHENISVASELIETANIHRLLNLLKSPNPEDTLECAKDLKVLAKSTLTRFWNMYTTEIVYTLLEPFDPAVSPQSPLSSQSRLALTGYTPIAAGVSDVAPQNSDTTFISINTCERMLICAKILLSIARFKGEFLKPLVAVIASRLLNCANSAPIAVTLHTKQIFSALSTVAAYDLFQVVLPFTKDSLNSSCIISLQITLYVLTDTIKHMKVEDVDTELKNIVPKVLPLLGSSFVGNIIDLIKLTNSSLNLNVDIRKCVIFLLVEIYAKVGDQVHCHLKELSPAQVKLLKIYINRRLGNEE